MTDPGRTDDGRGTAQAVFRSALFPAMSFKGGRPFLKEERLCSVDGVEVFFTGERFDQFDLKLLACAAGLHWHPAGIRNQRNLTAPSLSNSPALG